MYFEAKDGYFFGPGICELLEEIGKCGSIQAACKEMGLSYSKGSHILKNLEKGLGIPMVRDIESYAKEAYRKYFSDILGECAGK